MKALLEAVRTALRNATDLSYISDANIFVVPDEDVIPYTATFPAIGLRDGAIERIVEDAETWEVRLQVHVVVYQLLRDASDASIMGQTAPQVVYGILDTVEDIHTVLNDNLLGITGMELAHGTGESGSQTIGYDNVVIQRKTVTYEYRKLEARP